MFFVDAPQRGFSICRKRGGVALGLEVDAQHQQHVGFVVDDEDLLHRLATTSFQIAT